MDSTAVCMGGLVVGGLCGLLPFFLGKSAERTTWGVVSWVICILAGLVGGLLFAVPAAVLCAGALLLAGTPSGYRPRPGPRTVRDFAVSGALWSSVEEWARGCRYHLKWQTASQRRYQNGVGFWTAPTICEITQETSDQVHVEAWVHVPPLSHLLALFLVPEEMGVESGGYRLALPRRLGRNGLNRLLSELGQEPIG